jgi:hypothetical protein
MHHATSQPSEQSKTDSCDGGKPFAAACSLPISGGFTYDAARFGEKYKEYL